MVDSIIKHGEIAILATDNAEHDPTFFDMSSNPGMKAPLVRIMSKVAITITEPCLYLFVIDTITYTLYQI